MFGVPSLSERQHTPIRARYSRIFEGKVRVKRKKKGDNFAANNKIN